MIEVSVESSYYPSLCYYMLGKLGFLGQRPDSEFERWSQRLSSVGSSFAFCAPFAGGPLFTLIYQIPGYLNPKTPHDLVQIASDLKEAVIAHDITPVVNRATYLDGWYTTAWVSNLFSTLSGQEHLACEVIDTFTPLALEQWQVYAPLFHERLAKFPWSEAQALAGKYDYFGKWQEILQTEYPYSRFCLIVCPESRTLASSLGPEKVVYGSCHSIDHMQNTLFHEIGVRFANLGALASDHKTSQIMKDDYGGMIKIIEAEICHLKPALMPGLVTDLFIRGMKLDELVAWRRSQPEIFPLPDRLTSLYTEAKRQGLI